ncbi:MAG: hypothetical protein AAF340_08555 [Pseudomonadota bacterium]
MKMTIGAELPEDYEPAHTDLAAAANTLIAHSLLPMFQDAMGEQLAKANVEGIMTELAFALDEGAIEIGGKTYRPRLAFVDDAGQVVPGAADFDSFNEVAGEPFEIDPEAKVSFEAGSFEDDA